MRSSAQIAGTAVATRSRSALERSASLTDGSDSVRQDDYGLCEHEGYVAHMLADGSSAGTWTTEIARHTVGWRCECRDGWVSPVHDSHGAKSPVLRAGRRHDGGRLGRSPPTRSATAACGRLHTSRSLGSVQWSASGTQPSCVDTPRARCPSTFLAQGLMKHFGTTVVGAIRRRGRQQRP